MPFKQTLKYAAIRAGLETVALTRAGALWPAAGGRGLIFTLHHVRPAGPEPFAPNALLSVTPQFLDRAIEACAESGLTPVTLEDLPARLSDPADTRRFVSFTLDDGYRNNAEHAAPVFRRHGVPFTIFVTGGFVERTRSAWWETAEALIRGTNEAEFDFGDGPEKVAMRTVAEKDAAFHRFSRFVQTEDEDEAVARIDRLAATHGVDPLGIVDRLVSEGLVARARRNGDRRTSMVRLTDDGAKAFADLAAAHEKWIGELLGNVSEDDARRLAGMLTSFRSNWEGRE